MNRYSWRNAVEGSMRAMRYSGHKIAVMAARAMATHTTATVSVRLGGRPSKECASRFEVIVTTAIPAMKPEGG